MSNQVMSYEELYLRNRIALLSERHTDNQRIINKLKRQLNNLLNEEVKKEDNDE